MSTEERVRSLPPLRFQALALVLLRKEFGHRFEDVRDTNGEGNGCDGLVVEADHVHGFQVKTVENELGDTQKRHAKESLDLALVTIPQERGLPLTKYTFVFNLDLKPSEAKWFTGQIEKYAAKSCQLAYRALGWVVAALLDEHNAGIRREFVESEADRQLAIIKAIAAGGAATQEALAGIIGLVKGLQADDAAKRALVTLLERARAHFEAGIASLAGDSFRQAATALTEAKALLTRHHEDPLYLDVVYWHAVAMLQANDWRAALDGFIEAERLYKAVGREEEALWARGNQGHALRALARHVEALSIFREVNKEWANRRDLHNILAGHLNEAEIHMELGDATAAAAAFEAANAIIASASSEQIVEHDLSDIILHLFGSLATFHFAMDNDEGALKYLDAAIESARAAGKKHFLAKCLCASMSSLTFSDRIPEALARAVEAEALLKDIGDESSLGRLYNNLGVAYHVCGNRQKAREYFIKDLDICMNLGDDAGADKTRESMVKLGYKPSV